MKKTIYLLPVLGSVLCAESYASNEYAAFAGMSEEEQMRLLGLIDDGDNSSSKRPREDEMDEATLLAIAAAADDEQNIAPPQPNPYIAQNPETLTEEERLAIMQAQLASLRQQGNMGPQLSMEEARQRQQQLLIQESRNRQEAELIELAKLASLRADAEDEEMAAALELSRDNDIAQMIKLAKALNDDDAPSNNNAELVAEQDKAYDQSLLNDQRRPILETHLRNLNAAVERDRPNLQKAMDDLNAANAEIARLQEEFDNQVGMLKVREKNPKIESRIAQLETQLAKSRANLIPIEAHAKRLNSNHEDLLNQIQRIERELKDL